MDSPGDGADSRNLDEIDAQFRAAGLVRSRRGNRAGVPHSSRFQKKTPEELRPAAAQLVTADNGVQWVVVPAWSSLPWLWYGFSTRLGGVSRAYAAEDAGGDLNLGFTPEDERQNVLRNRQLLAEAVAGDPAVPLITVRQIHSSVTVLAHRDPVDRPCKGDGLMTDRPGILLAIQTADCIPVLVADRRRKTVAAFHAGWRGTVKRIVENGVGRMRLEFGSHPADLTAAIGPGIGPCCYAVGEEVLNEFESQFSYASELFSEVTGADALRAKYPMLLLAQRAPGHSPAKPSLHLDLVEANRRQLLAAGLAADSIHVAGGCTSCQPEVFFSHRESKGKTGRMMSVIGVRPE